MPARCCSPPGARRRRVPRAPPTHPDRSNRRCTGARTIQRRPCRGPHHRGRGAHGSSPSRVGSRRTAVRSARTQAFRHSVALTRDVRLVLCSPDGEVFGALPRFEVALPWWQEMQEVIGAARERFGVDAVVLRLLSTDDNWPPHGGAVSYRAEVAERPSASVALEPVDIDMADHPLRMRWAKPGGVTDLVRWAEQVVVLTAPAQLVRTWNLSCILRLPTKSGTVWLKAVPPFFA